MGVRTYKRYIRRGETVKIKLSLILALLIFVSCLTTTGVFATWRYSNPDVAIQSQNVNVGVGIGGFIYKPEQILPGIEADKLDENHLDLVNNILYEASYGLNATKKPVIHEYLSADNNVIYGNQNVSGGNLKHVLTNKTGAENLQFAIKRISATEYHTYTFSETTLRNTMIGQTMLAYKTIMVKGEVGKWTATRSYQGVATVFDPGVVSKSINVNTFIET